MFRFLLSRRWLGLGLFVAFMAIASWFLGNWQLDRWDARKDSNERAAVQLAKSPEPFASIRDDDGSVAKKHQWANIELAGQFRTDTDIVVRYIKRNSSPGVDIVTPFDTTSGETVLVNRGWMETANTGARPENIPSVPTGTITISGWWQPDAIGGSRATVPEDDSIRAINSRDWTERLGNEAAPGYIGLQEPHIAGLDPMEPPELGNGPHFFYALQWFFFGLLAIFGGFLFVRNELKDQRDAPSKPSVPQGEPSEAQIEPTEV